MLKLFDLSNKMRMMSIISKENISFITLIYIIIHYYSQKSRKKGIYSILNYIIIFIYIFIYKSPKGGVYIYI